MDSENTKERDNSKRTYQFMVLAGIILISINLRPGMTSVGPLMGIIRDDLGLANWSVGLLTGLPLLAFALISPIVPGLAKRFSNERTVIIGLVILLMGISLRSVSIIVLLFIGTLLIGFGIAICNVLLPGIVKEKYPLKIGLMTSIYSTAMAIFAATSSGLSIPLARGLNLGWQLALLFWTLPLFIAILVWIYLSKKKKSAEQVKLKNVSSVDRRIWRSSLAWKVALYMGLQSILFYVVISWLPEILIGHYGVSIATGGWVLSYTQFIGIPTGFLIPVLAERFSDQRPIVILLSICSFIGFTGLLIGTSFFTLIISTTLIGIVLNGNFALALTMLGLRARNSGDASELSGMAQSVGYLLAAIGPVSIGFLFDLTQDWTIPIYTLLGVTFLVLIFGLQAGKSGFVLD